MAKEIFRRNKDKVNKIREHIQSDNSTSAPKDLPDIIKKAGGSIAEVKHNRSFALKNWLLAKQESNPLIGKHITSAPEYSTDHVVLDQKVDELTPDIQNQINEGAAPYNPDNDTTEVEDLGEAPKADHGKDKKFIDINIIENTTRRLIGKPDSAIETDCKIQMKAYHDDNQYKSGIDVSSRISNYKEILKIEAEQKKMFLEDNSNTDADPK